MTDGDLPSSEALYLEIGRVAQLHVRLDSSLRQIFVQLATPSLAVYLVNDNPSTTVVVEACKTMLKHADVPDEVREAGLLALESAKEASRERNRVVHDMWLPDTEVGGDLENPLQWTVLRAARRSSGYIDGGRRDLESINSAHTQVLRSLNRLGSMRFALDATLPFYKSLGFPKQGWPLEYEIDVMADRFEMTEEGGVRPPPDRDGDATGTPEPPTVS